MVGMTGGITDVSDEVMQDLDRMLRVGLTTAGQLGEQLRRRAADADRRARDAALDEQRAATEQVRALRDEARSHYAKVGWADWQDHATLADWATAYQVARQMREHDPVAAAAHDRIEVEVRRRYNVDIREALQLHLQQVAEDQRIRAEHERDDLLDHHPPAPNLNDPAPTEDHDPPEPTDRRDPTVNDQGPGADMDEDAAFDLEPDDVGPTAEPTGPTTDSEPVHVDEGVVIIPGEVVTDDEMAQARDAAQTAAQGFEQTGGAALRQHRTTLRSRLRRPAKRDRHAPARRRSR